MRLISKWPGLHWLSHAPFPPGNPGIVVPLLCPCSYKVPHQYDVVWCSSEGYVTNRATWSSWNLKFGADWFSGSADWQLTQQCLNDLLCYTHCHWLGLVKSGFPCLMAYCKHSCSTEIPVSLHARLSNIIVLIQCYYNITTMWLHSSYNDTTLLLYSYYTRT